MVKISATVLGLAAAVVASPVDLAPRDTACGATFVSGSHYYQLLCDQVVYGTPIDGGYMFAATPADCAAQCEAAPNCVQAKYQASYCHQQSTKTSPIAATGWKTIVKGGLVPGINCADGSSNGAVYTSGDATYDIVCNAQYYGNDIANKPRRFAASFEDCIAACSTEADCIDVVYDKAQYCYLKSSKRGGLVASPNWWSAIKRV